MPTQRIRKCDPSPMKIDATTLIRSSFIRSRVNFVQVTSYTKNQAVKNNPIAIKTNVKWANIAGFTGLAYLAMFSIPIYETEKNVVRNTILVEAYNLPFWFQNLNGLTLSLKCNIIYCTTIYCLVESNIRFLSKRPICKVKEDFG